MSDSLFPDQILTKSLNEEINLDSNPQVLYSPRIINGKIEGNIDASNAWISDAVIDGIGLGSEVSIQGWTSNMGFSSTDYNTVAWTAGNIVLTDGTSFSILEGNTGNISETTYIYFDKNVSKTALQTTTTHSNSIGGGRILIAVATPNSVITSNAIFQVFGGQGGMMIATDNIAASAVTAAKTSIAAINPVDGEINPNKVGTTQIVASAVTPNKIISYNFQLSAGTFTNNSPTAGKIAWAGVKVVYDGTEHSITDGSCLATDKHVYWQLASPTVFSGSATLPALGNDDFLVLFNSSGTALYVWNSTIVNGNRITTGSITATQISANTITANEIAANTITAAEILAGTITATEIAALTITAANIAANTITAAKIAADTITANEMAANTITAAEISTGLYSLIDADFPPDTNLVGYWSFDEGSGLVAHDGSDNGNDGVITGATFVPGVAGTAVNLNGDTDNVNLGDITALNSVANFSFSGWFKQDIIDTLDTICRKYKDDNNEINIWTYTNGRMYFQIKSGGSGSAYIDDYSTYVTAGTPFFLRVEYDGTQSTNALKLKAFINEVQVGLSFSSNIPATTADLSGNNFYLGYTSSSWDGTMDDARLYSTNPTNAQGYALYKNPGQGKCLAIPVGRLTSGYIYSKQIFLSAIEGAGDAYIATGDTAFDFANWRGGTSTLGAIAIGIDDSVANNPAKAFIGNFYTHKYFQFDGDDFIQTGVLVNQFFGDGSDGIVTFDGSSTVAGATRSGSTYTLTRNVYYYDMTINSGVTLKPNGYRIFNLGKYLNHGTISNVGLDGSPGGNVSGAPNLGGAGGAGGGGATRGAGSFDRMEKGSDGGDGGDGGVPTTSPNGKDGEDGEDINPSIGGVNGIAGGNGGECSAYTKGLGGTAGAATNEDIELNYRDYIIESITEHNLVLCVERLIRGVTSGDGLSVPAGAGGGGGGSSYAFDHGASGGGGGGGGGIIYIAARTIDAASDGIVTVKGGMGEAGHSSPAGAAGGGGPGAGGIIIIVSTTAMNVGDITYTYTGGDLNGTAGQTFNGWVDDRPNSNGYNAADDGNNGKFYYLRIKGIN